MSVAGSLDSVSIVSTLSLFNEAPEERVFRVAELNRSVRGVLEAGYSDIWVEGEASDVSRAASGHIYFTLNDDKDAAQIRCVMFRGDATRAKARIENGARVRLKGSVSLYEPRGSFQFVARIALHSGEGALAAEFERLRKKLEGEGLFAPERKRALPLFPRVIGVVTSQSGAALHDILRVSKGRSPVRIVIADCRVQGEGSPESILRALEAIQKLPEVEVVIVARGGGSQEDLWSFNDERVVRAIAACRVPTVSGVGHEVDITLADLAADLRAATPSNAAELVVPDARALVQKLESGTRQLERALESLLGRSRLRLEKLQRHLEDPRRAVSGVRARLHSLEQSLERHMTRKLALARARASDTSERLSAQNPRRKLDRDRARLIAAWERAVRLMRPGVSARRVRFVSLAGKLDALSPLAVLARGYAIVLDQASGQALVDASEVQKGSVLSVRLHRGTLDAVVSRTVPGVELPVERQGKP